jgi:cytochrome c biogenesis protein CcdA
MLGSLLLLGLLLGLKHALEADHLSTVATLASRSSSTRQTMGVATAWGLGHAASLVALGTVLVALGAALPEAVARAFELAIGLILIALGIDVLRRLRRSRIHVHVHEHGGERHLHAHAHEQRSDEHQHSHRSPLWYRSLAIGGVHGLAGSAAVTVLALPAGSIGRALLYLLVFGAGTVLGMMALTLAVSWPLKFSAQWNSRAWIALQCLLSVIDLALGTWIVVQSAFV